jgi:uncharacterized protein (DUF488 family)
MRSIKEPFCIIIALEILMKLSTIGYEGIKPDRFFNILDENCISTLIDIREIPLSRKPGFSKGSLQKESNLHGIVYKHIPALGSPKVLREAYKVSGDWAEFYFRYSDYLNRQSESLEILVRQIQVSNCCLLCFEENPYRCHRSIIANKTKQIIGDALEIIHFSRESRVPIVSPCLSLALAVGDI